MKKLRSAVMAILLLPAVLSGARPVSARYLFDAPSTPQARSTVAPLRDPNLDSIPAPPQPEPGSLFPDAEEVRARQAMQAVLEKGLRHWGPGYQVGQLQVRIDGVWAHGLAPWLSRERTLAGPINILAHRLPQGFWQALMPDSDGLYPQWLEALPEGLLPAAQKAKVRAQAAEAGALRQSAMDGGATVEVIPIHGRPVRRPAATRPAPRSASSSPASRPLSTAGDTLFATESLAVVQDAVWWAQERAHQTGWRLPSDLGLPGAWDDNAPSYGLQVGDVPMGGSIAVWEPDCEGAGPEGHVAFVEQVRQDAELYISESGWECEECAGSRTISPPACVRYVYRPYPTLFQYADYAGAWRHFEGDVEEFQGLNFEFPEFNGRPLNDRASSIWVPPTWTVFLYRYGAAQGRCGSIGFECGYTNLHSLTFNDGTNAGDQASSLRASQGVRLEDTLCGGVYAGCGAITLDLLTGLTHKADMEIVVMPAGDERTCLDRHLVRLNAEGDYVGLELAEQVRPGTYDVYVKAANRLRTRKAAVVLNAGQNAPLEVGALVSGDTEVGGAIGDNRVNWADLMRVVTHYGQWYPGADVNGDGVVNAVDRSLVVDHMGQSGTGWTNDAPCDLPSEPGGGDTTARIYLTPESGVYQVGDALDVGVHLDSGSQQVAGVDLLLRYDPGVFGVRDADPDTTATEIVAGDLFGEPLVNVVDTARGVIFFTTGEDEGPPVQGTGLLATIPFEVRGAIGNTVVEVAYVEGWTAETNAVEAGSGADVLGSAEGAQFTITGLPARPLPTISFTPAANSRLRSSWIDLEAQASATYGQVTAVRFDVDLEGTWTEIGTDSYGSDGWSLMWDASELPDGLYSLRASALLPGDEGSEVVHPNVLIDRIPPRYVSATFGPSPAPSPGILVTITVEAADEGSGVDSIAVYANSANDGTQHGSWELLGTIAGSQGTISWDTSGRSAGVYQVGFDIRDRAGNQDADPHLRLLYEIELPGQDAEPPVLNWRTPVEDGSTYACRDERIDLAVSAADNVAVDRVRFYRWDVAAGEYLDIHIDDVTPYEAVLDCSSLAYGSNDVLAEAYDTSDNASGPKVIYVNRLTPAPDLEPHIPGGYAFPVVPSSVPGTHEPNTLYAGVPTYFDWHFVNSGDASAVGEFSVELWVDDDRMARSTYSNYGAGWAGGSDDQALTIQAPGWHTVRLVTDADQTVAESDEDNNTWQREFYWQTTCGDGLEPNNTPAQATALAFDETKSAYICAAGDEDVYTFVGQAGDRVVVDVDAELNGSALDAEVYLLDSDGTTVLAQSDDEPASLDAKLGYELPHPGTYYVRVREFSHPLEGGTDYYYTLRLLNDGTAPLYAGITAPLYGAWLDPDSTTVRAYALDIQSGVQRVEFLWHDADWQDPNWTWLGADWFPADGWSWDFDTSGVPELQGGALSIWAYDWAGNWTSATVSNLGLDRTPPTVSARVDTGYDDAPFVDFWVLWDGATDNLSGPADYDVQVRDGLTAGWTDLVTGTVVTGTRFIGQDGHSYYFRARARDRAGNQGTYAGGNGDVEHVVSVCQIAPDAYEPDGDPASAQWLATDGITQTHNVHSLGDEDWVMFYAAEGVVYNLSTTNIGGHADTVLSLYDTDGSSLIEVNDDDPANPPSSRLLWSPSTSGTYYARVAHGDPWAYGCTTVYGWQILSNDIVPPIGAVTIDGGLTYASSRAVTLTLTASDAGTGVSQVMISNSPDLSGASWTDYEPTLPWVLPEGDGPKAVYVRFRDRAGNTSAIFNDLIILDETPPTGSMVIDAGAAYATSASVQLDLEAVDTGAGLDQMMIANDEGFAGADWMAFAVSLFWNLGAPEGERAVYAKFRDGAGNESATYSDTILLDTQPPTGTVTIDGGAQYAASRVVTLTLSAQDTSTGVYQVKLSNYSGFGGAAWIDYVPSLAWTLAAGDGPAAVYAKYRDWVGHESATYSDTIVVDTIPPTGSIVIEGGAPSVTSPNVTLALSANDTNGVTQMRLRNEPDAWATWEPYVASRAWVLLPEHGEHTIWVQYRDAAGNLSPAYSDSVIYRLWVSGLYLPLVQREP